MAVEMSFFTLWGRTLTVMLIMRYYSGLSPSISKTGIKEQRPHTLKTNFTIFGLYVF
ncbi:unnamed protein product [Hymenolepis diminuta]|uniref:Uncharacterized protein n=1 Tax=Hymenolepis diminuta TaxID=6216 RepID=A0A564XWM5_HYMDI|nr:unnamed protein product [Hymenolepis diminuta]